MKGNVISILSIKGGVGKTTVTTNLASAMNEFYNKDVLIIDGNLSSPNIAYYFGMVDNFKCIKDYFSKKAKLEEVIYPHHLGFHILPASIRKDRSLKNPLQLKRLVDKLRKYYDVILIDTSPLLNLETLAAMISSDKMYVVTTPDHLTLINTIHAIKKAKERHANIQGIIINRIKKKSFELTKDEIEFFTSTPVIGLIPEHDIIKESLANFMPVVAYKKSHKISKIYQRIAARILGEKEPERSFLDMIKEFLKI